MRIRGVLAIGAIGLTCLILVPVIAVFYLIMSQMKIDPIEYYP